MSNKKFWLCLLLLLLGYFALTSYRLLALPVFADEAIYIRWAQLIIDDAGRYFFYPMNDGKTPLLMWLMAPMQYLFTDQLYAARIVSVLVGALTVLGAALIAKELSNKKSAGLWAAFLAIILPFTFFHYRLAITDALLLSNLTLTYWLILKIIKGGKIFYIPLAAFTFFLAIMSKTPALLAIPSFYLTVFFLYREKAGWRQLLNWRHPVYVALLKISLVLALAGLAFYSLRVVPLFSQLFSVGGSFLHPVSTILTSEIWAILAHNSRFFCTQLLYYLGPAVLLISLPWLKNQRRSQLILLLSALSIILPLTLLGKVIYPRYLLPSALFFIISAALFFSHSRLQWLKIILLAAISTQAGNFIYHAYFDINRLPLSPADRIQYLEEWSAGQGIKESSDLIQEIAQNSSVAVATEGHFGTLPDGILLYLHRRNVDSIYVEGIGQPIRELPTEFLTRASNYQKTLLIVNSHRLLMDLNGWQLLKEYCRPEQAPCLQVWEKSN